MKPQSVRALDVFVLGPFLVGVAVGFPRLPAPVRLGLAAVGVGTVVYNARNFMKAAARPEAA